MAFDETLAGRVRALRDERADGSERQMFGGLTVLIRGHMCCGVSGRELILRLGTDGADERSPLRTSARWTSPVA